MGTPTFQPGRPSSALTTPLNPRGPGRCVRRPTLTGGVLCSLLVAGFGVASFVMEYGVTREGISVGRGSGVLVFIDYQTGENHRIPDDMRAAIASLES